MKIAIISRHSVANYGSLFQAYALQTTIESLNHEAINIDYTPLGEKEGNLAYTLVNISRWSKNPITKALFLLYQYPSFTHTFKIFKAFRKQYLKETREYLSNEELRNECPVADLYCTGSDQVWNLLYDNKVDDTYFLSFLPDEQKRFSYASSFGGNRFAGQNWDKYQQLLKKYFMVTVREDSGISLLKEFGIEGEQVLDPTLLLSTEEWCKLIPEKKLVDFPYLLIYQLRPNKEFDQYAVRLAKKEGLKLIRISPMFFQSLKCGWFHYLPKPEEFLWYIKNATCLLTDSFHGTCFAVNFRTQFIEILPGRFNARNESLLRAMKLENRILKNYSDFEIFNQEIDYDSVHSSLSVQREKSVACLREMILSGKNEIRTKE